MRKDSCRNCGIIMQEFQHCAICKEVNQFTCKQCRRASDEQVHMRCNHIARQLILN